MQTSQSRQQPRLPFLLHHSLLVQGPPSSVEEQATVNVLLFFNDMVCLVQPNLPGVHDWWVPPQSSVLKGDGTLIMAALRTLKDEFGLEERDVVAERMRPLVKFRNIVPEGRKHPPGTIKVHHVVGVPLRNFMRLKLNRDRLARLAWVPTPQMLSAMMSTVAQSRAKKYRGVCAALNAAQKSKLISWSARSAAH